MAYAGKIEDLPPEERYADSRLESLIEQAVKPIWLREILGGFLYKLKQLESSKYDIAIWEFDLKQWQVICKIEDPLERFRAYLELEPTRIMGEKLDFIPRKGEEIQICHALYKVVKVTYDLEEDYITLLVVRMR